MSKLDKTIEKLKIISYGKKMNIYLPNDDLLNEYEQKTGIILSEDYRKVLKSISNVFYGTKELLSVTNNSEYYRELSVALNDTRKMGIPKDWIPICEDNGDYYCLNSKGEIKYWSRDGCSDESWENLESWIEQVWIGND